MLAALTTRGAWLVTLTTRSAWQRAWQAHE